jgi:hypothetical protein
MMNKLLKSLAFIDASYRRETLVGAGSTYMYVRLCTEIISGNCVLHLIC